MAVWTVQESLGDFLSLKAAVDDGGVVDNDEINIQGAWTIDDPGGAISIGKTLTITCVGAAKHKGHYNPAGDQHWRLVNSATSTHCISMGNKAKTIVLDGLAILQNSSGTSDEGIRCDIDPANTATIKNTLIHMGASVSQQDGVYTGSGGAGAGDITIEQCIISGAGRGGIHQQQQNTNNILNVNSCTIWGCALPSGDTYGGGIVAKRTAASPGQFVNVQNCTVVGNHVVDGDSEDFRVSYTPGGEGVNIDWTISNSIASDLSISAHADTVDFPNQENKDPVDSPTADSVLFTDLASNPPDLRLVTDVGNVAEEMHTNAAGSGLTIPTADIAGTSRPQDTNYDCGAFEILKAPTGPAIPVMLPTGLQKLSGGLN